MSEIVYHIAAAILKAPSSVKIYIYVFNRHYTVPQCPKIGKTSGRVIKLHLSNFATSSDSSSQRLSDRLVSTYAWRLLWLNPGNGQNLKIIVCLAEMSMIKIPHCPHISFSLKGDVVQPKLKLLVLSLRMLWLVMHTFVHL